MKNSYWFVDSVFKKNPIFRSMDNITFLKAGEELKSLKAFEENFKKLIAVNANRKTTVYCLGGGSLGDSVGFLCSVYMRGLRFVMLPTTWLASVDSSVGGKTALNGFGYKNIMGTFYPPEKNIYVEDFIKSSSLKDAEGEIFKTLILNHNKKWAKDIMLSWEKDKLDFPDLPKFIKYKTDVVKKDPRDLKGVRAFLNLGHSLGHAIELEKGLSHGEAVKQGVLFSLRWSAQRNLLSAQKTQSFEKLLSTELTKISDEKLFKALKKDKKSEKGDSLNFVFIGDKGPILEKVQIKQVVAEYKRQLCLPH